MDASEYAYGRFSSPGAPLVILTYGVTPWLPIAMAAKTLYDAATTAKLAREEW